ncbi:MAG: hypothetical protein E7597_05220 [Ruminococcaceae bacterium]|nr:hypothetical protein [Oscillospiraceae bacterium]
MYCVERFWHRKCKSSRNIKRPVFIFIFPERVELYCFRANRLDKRV